MLRNSVSRHNRLLKQRTTATEASAVHPKLLFTPGPLLTSWPVKAAMNIDYGSRDASFVESVAHIRRAVVDIAGIESDAERKKWACVPLPGSGTMGVEAAISTCAPRSRHAKALVVSNGAYGVRHANICRRLGIETAVFEWPEGKPIDVEKFDHFMATSAEAKGITTFVVVHSETSTGILNPVEQMCKIVRDRAGATADKCTIIVDAMSSFGGIPIAVDKICDILVSSSNKCIQGVPGFSISLARRDFLDSLLNNSRSFTLDLTMQHQALERTGQFPFTPPTHVIQAFRRALFELEKEGGVEARHQRYCANAQYIIDEMATPVQQGGMGFELFVKDPAARGPFIVSFVTPNKQTTGFDFSEFYKRLSERDIVLYPGKAAKADTFRIGCIGDLHRQDFELLSKTAREVLKEMNVKL